MQMIVARPAASAKPRRHAIPTWRLVAGALLHFIVPAYLVATPAAAFLTAPAGAALDVVLARLPICSAWFLAGYVALSLLSVGAVGVVEPLLRARAARRESRDPATAIKASERRVAGAIANGTRLGRESAQILDNLRGRGWDHADPRFQALSADLAEVVRTALAAIATAPAERRPALQDLAATSLRRIAGAYADLRSERSRLDEGDAQAVARYVQIRYGPSDFSGEAP